jgi:hypothetical protein
MSKILETKSCVQCSQDFPIYQEDVMLLEKLSPKIWSVSLSLPLPKSCPDCRQQQRLSFRNERHLYKSQCNASGKPIISLHSPDTKYTTYDASLWDSDAWSADNYQRDYDENSSFFQQFSQLLDQVPKKSLYGLINENSDFTNDCTHCKDCYLLYASDYCENSYYGLIQNTKNSVDCNESAYLQECYECIDCDHLQNVRHAQDSKNCNDCDYIYACTNCSDCFLCSNLNWKKYCILNTQYTKSEYQQELQKYHMKDNILELYAQVKKQAPKKSSQISQSENCLGNYILNSKNCFYCFDASQAEDSRYIFYWSLWTKDCMDTSMASINAVKCYNSQCCLENCNNIICCNFCINVQNSFYLDNCIRCKDCFWCVWLKDKQYCIFNTQYTKEVYERILLKIFWNMTQTWEWGNFFPIELSPYWYNQTVANDYYPLSKQEVQNLWWKWSEYIPEAPKVDKIISAASLPKDISNIPDDILNWAIKCEITGAPFRIIKPELEFYRKHTLQIPRIHPDERYLQRVQCRRPRKIFKSTCTHCETEVQTTYPPGSHENMYCETCYNKEIY